jgi:nitric oxide synthase-interacting protein
LLSQKKDIKRQTMLLERMKEEEENDLIKAKLAARDRVLKEFEQTQTGLSATAGVPTNQLLRRSVISSSSSSSLMTTTTTTTTTNGVGGVKRKFDLDSREIERLTKESEDKAAKKIAIELIESRKAKLPNFWLVRSFHHYFSLSSRIAEPKNDTIAFTYS